MLITVAARKAVDFGDFPSGDNSSLEKLTTAILSACAVSQNATVTEACFGSSHFQRLLYSEGIFHLRDNFHQDIWPNCRRERYEQYP